LRSSEIIEVECNGEKAHRVVGLAEKLVELLELGGDS